MYFLIFSVKRKYKQFPKPSTEKFYLSVSISFFILKINACKGTLILNETTKYNFKYKLYFEFHLTQNILVYTNVFVI